MAEPALIQEISAANAELVNSLVSDAFLYKKPHQFFDDFPIWGSERIHRFGVFQDQRLISHVGIRLTAIGPVRVGLIGAVATHIGNRGQGQSSRLLEHTIKFAETRNVEWLALWGSEHEFYSKFGFGLVGTQTRIKLGEILKTKQPARIMVVEGYTPKIFDALLTVQTPTSVTLTPADRPWFEKHKTVQWFWTAAPFSFVGFERGMDLPHIVHEWGGDAGALTSIFQHVYKADPSAEILTHPLFLTKLGLTPDIAHVNERLCLAKPMKDRQTWPDEYWISGLNSC
ncbi:MAG: GNAT family N-acetyltransferase [Bdellovibrionales bacterium]|nr:GNAT family N-acetyltransferase [Bdellovibrionales bacterium]